jgi:phospholipase/carboxylesterase
MSQSRPESHVNRLESAFATEALGLPWIPEADELPGMPQALHCQVNEYSAGLIPENYEPRYPYPLVLWLPSDECDTDEALGHIGNMSPQNYIGLAVEDCILKTSQSKPSSLDSAVDQLRQLIDIENRIVAAVRSFREFINVHTERIFIAGVGEGATTAMLVAMHQPDWFGGCISFCGEFPAAASLIPGRPELDGKRFWLNSPGGRSSFTSSGKTRHAARMLIAAGADVATRVDDSHLPVSRSMLRDLDEWLIRGILSAS